MTKVPVCPRCTILFDNRPGPIESTLWGFAALIDIGERKILFDTGSNGPVLLRNMEALGVLGSIDLVFLSHPHWDHIGGLDSVLEARQDVTVVLHEGFSKHMLEDVRTLCKEVIVVTREPKQLLPGVFSTGMLESRPPEHALVLDPDTVTALISGCAHPGIERLIERGRSILNKRVDWAVGGFHMLDASSEEIAASVQRLKDLGLGGVVPTHCTGERGVEALEVAFAERCLPGGTGRVLTLCPIVGGETA